MAKLEKILGVLLIIGLSMGLAGITGGNIILLVASALLAMLYWPLGFALLSGIRGRELFRGAAYQNCPASQLVLASALGLLLAIAVLAITFCVLRWNGGNVMRLVGGGGLALGIVASLALRTRLALPDGGRGWLIRCFLVLSVLVATAFFPYTPRLAAAPAAVL